MDRQLAADTVELYVCAVCWSPLYERFDATGESIVTCMVHPEHEGYVTKAYAERRRAESLGEAAEVKELLNGLGITKNPHAGKTAEQIIAELY